MIIEDYMGSLDQRMEKLRAVLAGKEDLVLVGSSFGGLMVAMYACDNEGLVKRLILLAPALTLEEFSPYLRIATKRRGRPRTRGKKPKKVSLTDPEATMATSSRGHYVEPTYKQHTVVDDRAGIVIDVDLTTGEINEGTKLIETIERVATMTGEPIKRVTADKGYAHGINYGELARKGIDAVIPPEHESHYGKGEVSIRRFKYDGLHRRVVCPGGKELTRTSRGKNGWIYASKRRDCQGCRFRRRCVPPSTERRTILIVDGYEALVRVRRRKERGWDDHTRHVYNRHWYLVEGIHGEAKGRHGLRRVVRRGLENVAIQGYLTATVINQKRLAMVSYGPMGRLFSIMDRVVKDMHQAKLFPRQLHIAILCSSMI
jgi:predicted alpha/beta hydrolase family esterase